jgi:hypothetical protein
MIANAAHEWLSAGVPVFPVAMIDGEKRPIVKWRPLGDDGHTRPLTLDEATDGWRKAGSNCMPGLDCQAIGALVIDLDTKKDGIANFEALCVECGIDVSDCPIVITPTGGKHLFFADPTGKWSNSASKLAPGVDTRSVGGYVVAAGAMRPGIGLYRAGRPADLREFIATIAAGRMPPVPPKLAALLAKSVSALRPRPRGGDDPMSVNDDLSAGLEAPPRKIERVADGCPHIKNVLASGGADLTSEEQWRDMCRVAFFCEGGEDVAHRLCHGNPHYGRDETSQKYAYVERYHAGGRIGYIQCLTIHHHGAKECEACPEFQKALAVRDMDPQIRPSVSPLGTEKAKGPLAKRITPRVIAPDVEKAKENVSNAYVVGKRVSRPFALEMLGESVARIRDAEVKRALARYVVPMLAHDGWGEGVLMEMTGVLGLTQGEAARLTGWAIRGK